MNERTKSKTKTVTGVTIGILRRFWLYVLGIFVVIVVIVFVVSSITQDEPKEPVLLPPHEIAVKSLTYKLMGRIEESFSFYADWPAEGKRPGKEETIEAAKKMRERIQSLEYKLGPVEIRENETFDKATRVVVPLLSGKARNLTSGKVIVVPDFVDMILEKQESAEGQQWRIIGHIAPPGPRSSEIRSAWQNLPRKKVANSPTIILKKEDNSVIMQIISNGKVTNKSIVYLE